MVVMCIGSVGVVLYIYVDGLSESVYGTWQAE